MHVSSQCLYPAVRHFLSCGFPVMQITQPCRVTSDGTDVLAIAYEKDCYCTSVKNQYPFILTQCIGLPYFYKLFLQCMAKCMMLHISSYLRMLICKMSHLTTLFYLPTLWGNSQHLSLSLSHSEKKSQYEWIVCVVWQLNSYLGFFHTPNKKCCSHCVSISAWMTGNRDVIIGQWSTHITNISIKKYHWDKKTIICISEKHAVFEAHLRPMASLIFVLKKICL